MNDCQARRSGSRSSSCFLRAGGAGLHRKEGLVNACSCKGMFARTHLGPSAPAALLLAIPSEVLLLQGPQALAHLLAKAAAHFVRFKSTDRTSVS